ncbi:bifunctional diguanylate cyclase/phosphodiesterase [Senegalia massiliensis]|uniref:Phosphodiesterase n=1 Tax=Senegalia massiliensis TaxID=1720316 RepID=A0A845QYZ5_9CLOT|nr:EAL domain-containing protein [Senegalia massiliensis]NBI07184.1 phosphodiesterase [Senegalia massiliensis]
MDVINFDDFKNIIKRYLVITIPVIIIFIFMINYNENKSSEDTKQYIINEQIQKSNIMNFFINDMFSEMHEDLMLIKNSDEIHTYINDDIKNLDIVEKMFIRATNNKNKIEKIRFLNDTGDEIIRVDNENNKSKLIEKDKLENKINSYYYINTKNLRDGEIYISKMDLKMKGEKLQIPYTPLIRISTPVFTNDGKYKGILVISYDAREIIDVFEKYFDQKQFSFVDYSLLNSEGYYLHNKDNNKTFGFMYDTRKQYNLSTQNLALWNQINSKDEGIYETDDMVYYFMKLDKFSSMNKNTNENYWIAISSFNINDFNIVKDNIIFGMNSGQIWMMILLIVLFLFIITLVYFSKKNKEQLNITEYIAKNTNDAVIITDSNNTITYVNKSYEKITGYSKEEVIGFTPGNFKSGSQTNEFYKDMWKSINRKNYWRGELWDKRKDGILYPKDLSIYKIKNKFKKDDLKYIGIFTDLTELKKEQEYIDKLKDYNIDTNLPNENLLFKLIDSSIYRNKDKFFVIYFSIENYNSIVLNSEDNLKYILDILIKRINTILDKKDFIAHISKNKFVIGISSLKSKEEIDNFIKKLISISKLSYFVKEKELYFDLKVGISCYPNDGKNANELIINSNIALDKAIETQGKYYLYFDKELKEDIQNEYDIKLMLNKAIIYGEFSINYQPQVNSKTGDVIGAEALLRWNTKKLGPISPAVFIPIAERTGQIVEIGYWVIERVFKDYESLKEKIGKNFRISINISAMQFNDENFLRRIKESIEKNKINTSYFELEITESLLLSGLKQVNEKLNELRKLGFTIAIDDFGTGYSSLSYIKQLNINKLKIDRTFIKDYPNNDDGEIADIITNISYKLKLDVIAEGVETEEQIEYLKRKGCYLIQGYYYSKPLAKDEFLEYLPLT